MKEESESWRLLVVWFDGIIMKYQKYMWDSRKKLAVRDNDL